MRKREIIIMQVRPAGDDHQVVSIKGGGHGHCNKPCPDCPWRVDAVGEFPAEAFRHSASTAYDMSERTFACHQAGKDNPKTCAGFLLRGADHNLSVRIARMTGKIGRVSDGGHGLHENYRAMAIANGVDPNDPVLEKCR
jgi:hypothetical protein